MGENGETFKLRPCFLGQEWFIMQNIGMISPHIVTNQGENRKIYTLIPNRDNSEDGKNEARIASEYWKWKPQISTWSSFSQCHRLILSNQSREGFSLQWTIYLNIQMNDKCNKICFSDGTGLRLDRTGVTCLEFWRKPTHYPRPPLPLGVRSLFPYLPSYLRKSLGDCTRKKRQSETIYVGKNQPPKRVDS